MSSVKEKYDQIFVESFSIEAGHLGENTVYNQVPTWDSIGHMTMIAALESAFNIAMDADDVVNFSSYLKGMEILPKYGIEFSA